MYNTQATWQEKAVFEEKGATRISGNLVWVDRGTIFVKFGYNEEYVKECRKISGRHWDGKLNQFPLTSVAEVKVLADKWKIPVAEEVNLLEGAHVYDSMKMKREFGVTMDGNQVVISFDFNTTLISVINSYIPNTEWNKKLDVYKAPASSLNDAIVFAHEFGLTVDPDIEAMVAKAKNDAEELYAHSTILDWDHFDIPGLAKPLRPYQLAAVAYAMRVRRCIIADQPGLGKTVESISTVVLDGSLPVVVVCKNRLKETIREDFHEFYPDLKIEVLNGGRSKPIEKSDVIIVNYDIASQRISDIMEHGFKSLIVDESHYIKNGKKKSWCPHCEYKLKANAVNCGGCGAKKIKVKTQWSVRRTDATMKLAHSLPDDALVLLLTGTPINIRPAELIRQLECIDRLGLFGGEWKFRQRYCPDNKTAINLVELNTILRQNCFMRRKTSDVYGQLPPVQHSVQRMILSDAQMKRYQEVEDDVVGYLAEKARQRAIDEGLNGDAAYWNHRRRLERAEALLRINVLRGVIVDLKYEAMADWVDSFLDSGDEKVVLFAERIAVVEGFYERYKEMAVKVRGDVSNAQALAATHDFQEQDWCRVFAANLASAKEGFTLTASSHVIFCELAWAPTDHDQAVRRTYGRTNDPHGATAWWLLAPGTIDYEMFSLLQDRQKVVDAVTDGQELTEEQVSIIDQMIKILENKGR